MRSQLQPSKLFPVAILLPFLVTSYNLDCSNIKLGDAKWNLKALDGPHSLYKITREFPTVYNTTFTLDICRPLRKSKGKKKEEECPNGTRGECNVDHHRSLHFSGLIAY